MGSALLWDTNLVAVKNRLRNHQLSYILPSASTNSLRIRIVFFQRQLESGTLYTTSAITSNVMSIFQILICLTINSDVNS